MGRGVHKRSFEVVLVGRIVGIVGLGVYAVAGVLVGWIWLNKTKLRKSGGRLPFNSFFSLVLRVALPGLGFRV
jgi:hypothetical protein